MTGATSLNLAIVPAERTYADLAKSGAIFYLIKCKDTSVPYAYSTDETG